MNDEFLYRLRAEPPPHFVAALRTRLNQIDQASQRRRQLRLRSFCVVGFIAGAALATGLFVGRHERGAPEAADGVTATTQSSPVADQPPAAAPRASGRGASDPAATTEPKATDARRLTGQIRVGATVSVYPDIKAAAGYMKNDMSMPPTFPEPQYSMIKRDTAFPSLCASDSSIDLAVVDRRVSSEELEDCRRLKIHIAEVKLGYEAIVLARSNLYDAPKLTTRAIFLALAREIPDPLHPEDRILNPNVTWDQVDSSLPSEQIEVLGPALSSATGIAFRDLILRVGCDQIPTFAALKATDPERYEGVCGSVRTDGVYRVTDLAKRAGAIPFDLSGYLQANPQALALLGYREGMGTFRELNLAPSSIDGVPPTALVIHSGSYPGARTLYLYANTAVPQMRNFVYAIWATVGGAPGDSALTFIDPTERRSLLNHVLTLPDLAF